MHTYRKTPQGDGLYLYVVGFVTSDDATWYPLKDFRAEKAACAFTSMLNGGEYYDVDSLHRLSD